MLRCVLLLLLSAACAQLTAANPPLNIPFHLPLHVPLQVPLQQQPVVWQQPQQRAQLPRTLPITLQQPVLRQPILQQPIMQRPILQRPLVQQQPIVQFQQPTVVPQLQRQTPVQQPIVQRPVVPQVTQQPIVPQQPVHTQPIAQKPKPIVQRPTPIKYEQPAAELTPQLPAVEQQPQPQLEQTIVQEPTVKHAPIALKETELAAPAAPAAPAAKEVSVCPPIQFTHKLHCGSDSCAVSFVNLSPSPLLHWVVAHVKSSSPSLLALTGDVAPALQQLNLRMQLTGGKRGDVSMQHEPMAAAAPLNAEQLGVAHALLSESGGSQVFSLAMPLKFKGGGADGIDCDTETFNYKLAEKEQTAVSVPVALPSAPIKPAKSHAQMIAKDSVQFAQPTQTTQQIGQIDQIGQIEQAEQPVDQLTELESQQPLQQQQPFESAQPIVKPLSVAPTQPRAFHQPLVKPLSVAQQPQQWQQRISLPVSTPLRSPNVHVSQWWAWNIKMGADNVEANGEQSMRVHGVTDIASNMRWLTGVGPAGQAVTFIPRLTQTGPLLSFAVLTIAGSWSDQSATNQLRDAMGADLAKRFGIKAKAEQQPSQPAEQSDHEAEQEQQQQQDQDQEKQPTQLQLSQLQSSSESHFSQDQFVAPIQSIPQQRPIALKYSADQIQQRQQQQQQMMMGPQHRLSLAQPMQQQQPINQPTHWQADADQQWM